MLGVRFYPHTACVFLNTEVSQFNNRIGELPAGIHTSIRELHSKLLDTTLMHSRIELLDEFLLHRLSLYETKLNKTALISHVISELKQKDFFDNIENVASRYGITARYLQKLFIQHTGITPKLYSKINRFQNSLMLMSKKNSTLTDIAYECGYFDQSHFIREFKSFTGYIPSGFDIETSSAVFASPNK